MCYIDLIMNYYLGMLHNIRCRMNFLREFMLNVHISITYMLQMLVDVLTYNNLGVVTY